MKIDASAPRLPINRLKHPLRARAEKESDKPEDLLFGSKEGAELEKVVRKLYRRKIKK